MTSYLPNYFELSEGWSTFLFNEDNVPLYVHNTDPQSFNCFYNTPFESIKLIVLGTRPYPNKMLRTGLCYEVPFGSLLPSSLIHIYNKLEEEGYYPTRDGSFTYLAKQGVLFLNLEIFQDSDLFMSKLFEYILTQQSNDGKDILFLCMTPEALRYLTNHSKDTVFDYNEKGVFRKINQRLLASKGGVKLKIC